MLNLGKGIAEYEDKGTIKYLWEEPDRFSRIFDNDYFIISGRKGTGKSTIVDYKFLTSSEEQILILRPSEEDELYERIRNISIGTKIEHDELRNHLSTIFHTAFLVKIMKHFVKDRQNHLLTGDLATIYTFLTKNGLLEGSSIRKSIDLLSHLTSNFKNLNKIVVALDSLREPTFDNTKESLFRYLRNNKVATKFFVDDIDGIGFSYNKKNRAFLDGLVITCVTLNSLCIKNKVPLRVIITPPTELLDNAHFWNRDKIILKTIFLRWTTDKLQNLVNKRISAELGIYNRKKKHTDERLSTDIKRTWDKIFPLSVWNRIGGKENTLEYIVRHTFYTPRNVLSICQHILESLDDKGHTIESLHQVTDTEWATCIQGACEEQSNETTKNIIGVFVTMFTNIEQCLHQFEGRPNIWNKNSFVSFVRERCNGIVKYADNGAYINDDKLIHVLYAMGFIGFGFKNSLAPMGMLYYDLFFSYVKWTTQKKWDIAVISPVFYDYFHITPIQKLKVVPDGVIKVTYEQYEDLASYDHVRNVFLGKFPK